MGTGLRYCRQRASQKSITIRDNKIKIVLATIDSYKILMIICVGFLLPNANFRNIYRLARGTLIKEIIGKF